MDRICILSLITYSVHLTVGVAAAQLRRCACKILNFFPLLLNYVYLHDIHNL